MDRQSDLNEVTVRVKMEMMEDNPLTERNDKFLWKPFLRQVFVCSGVWASDFAFGLSFGAPAVLIPQVRDEANSTAAISEDMASWLSSGSGISGIFWVLALPYIATAYGRRISFLVVTLNSIIGYIIFYWSSSVLQILIAEVMLGAAKSCMHILSPMIITEYASPQYRGLLLTIAAVCVFWGIWVANAIGTFTHWKNIGIIGMVFSIYTCTAVFWPESPHWLASKGRFEKCSSGHRWLHGSCYESKAELKYLIASHRVEHSNNVTTESVKNDSGLKNLVNKVLTVVKDRQFYGPLTINLVLLLFMVFSGKMINTMYALDVLKKITGSTRASYYGMLILDGLTVFSAYVGCALAKVIKTKNFFLVSSFISILFMLIISLHLYLINFNVVSENVILSLILLSCYSISFSCGPLILGQSIGCEIAPFKFKSSIFLIAALSAQTIVAIALKMSPLLFKSLGMHGMFLMYGLTSLFFWGLLFKIVPETKDKTLQEIEEEFKK